MSFGPKRETESFESENKSMRHKMAELKDQTKFPVFPTHTCDLMQNHKRRNHPINLN